MTKQNDTLIHTSRVGDKTAVKKALKHGADIHARGDNALRLASYNGHTEIVALLEKYAQKHTKI